MSVLTLLLWCAIDGKNVVNCSEEKGICDYYPSYKCERCVELDYGETDCGEDIKTWEDEW